MSLSFAVQPKLEWKGGYVSYYKRPEMDFNSEGSDEMFVTPLYSPEEHPIAAAARLAWENHGDLVLSADMLWLVVMQTFGGFVEKTPTAFFKQFDSTKKEDLKVEQGALDLPAFFDKINVMLRDRLKDDAFMDALQASFSTTTPVMRQVMNLSVMNSLKSYFTFTVMTRCGIRNIRFEGTIEDYEKLCVISKELRKKTSDTGNKDWDWYIECVTVFFDEFITAMRDGSSNKFWQEFYYIPGHCMSGHEEGEPLGRLRYLFLDRRMFLSGTTQIPCRWIDLSSNTEHTMQIHSGAIGVKFDKDTNEFSVAPGWQIEILEKKQWNGV